jgi:hypothetical protein
MFSFIMATAHLRGAVMDGYGAMMISRGKLKKFTYKSVLVPFCPP